MTQQGRCEEGEATPCEEEQTISLRCDCSNTDIIYPCVEGKLVVGFCDTKLIETPASETLDVVRVVRVWICRGKGINTKVEICHDVSRIGGKSVGSRFQQVNASELCRDDLTVGIELVMIERSELVESACTKPIVDKQVETNV